MIARLLVLCLYLLTCRVPALADADPEQLSFRFDGHRRTVFVYAPPGDEPRPAIVLLHGSGRDGRSMLALWRLLAETEHLVLIAPDARNAAAWDSMDDSPAFLQAAEREVGLHHAFDPRRVFLFGHSGGAVYALALAAHNPGMFRAVAAHAGHLPESTKNLFQPDQGRTPVGLWVGDSDPGFPVQDVQNTAALLRRHGYFVQLTVLPGKGHGYDADAALINEEVWRFFCGADGGGR